MAAFWSEGADGADDVSVFPSVLKMSVDVRILFVVLRQRGIVYAAVEVVAQRTWVAERWFTVNGGIGDLQ